MNRNKPFTRINVGHVKKLESKPTCPHCSVLLLSSNAMSIEDHELPPNPKPGDMTLCSDCGGIAEFCDDLSLKVPSDELTAAMLRTPGVKETIKMIQDQKDLLKAAMKKGSDFKPEDVGESYFKQIKAVSETVKAWMKANPGASPSFQYNFPNEVFVITEFFNAAKKNFVTMNDDGRKMAEDLGWFKEDKEALTVMMVRTGIEAAYEQ